LPQGDTTRQLMTSFSQKKPPISDAEKCGRRNAGVSPAVAWASCPGPGMAKMAMAPATVGATLMVARQRPPGRPSVDFLHADPQPVRSPRAIPCGYALPRGSPSFSPISRLRVRVGRRFPSAPACAVGHVRRRTATMFSFSEGRRWTATGVLTRRRGPDEGSLSTEEGTGPLPSFFPSPSAYARRYGNAKPKKMLSPWPLALPRPYPLNPAPPGAPKRRLPKQKCSRPDPPTRDHPGAGVRRSETGKRLSRFFPAETTRPRPACHGHPARGRAWPG